MSGALEVSMIGMRAQQRALETVAGNISNINTPAYKRVDLRFSELVGTAFVDPVKNAPRRQSDVVAGVASWTQPLLDTQGQIDQTGNPQDLAIDGVGFIELLGPGGKTLLWRGGSIRVMEDGVLATAAGQQLKAGITVPLDATALRIDADGKVFANQPVTPGETQIGEIALTKVIDPAAIERLDGGVYLLNDEAGVMVGTAGEDGLGHLVQASLERSNVDLNSEMIALLIAQRAYSANAQVAKAADEFYGIANGLRR